MKHLIFILFLLASLNTRPASPSSYDVVIVGGTPAGITAAIAAAREGKNCIILERSQHLGGLPVNGLGATDIATRGATTGLFGQFVDTNKAYYAQKYGTGSKQYAECSNGYHFEPSVAAITFEQMIRKAGPGKIQVLTLRQFDAHPKYVIKRGQQIVSIRIFNRATAKEEFYNGKVFIDATYEGDLGAAAGVPYKLGREGAEEYNEPCAGNIYRWWKHGPNGEESTNQGDNAIQAYNYRLCLTNNPNNRLSISQPKDYNREEYLSLVDDVLDGRNTDSRYRKADSHVIAENRRKILSGERTSAPGDVWGMAKLTSMTLLPNGKTDANNQHLALISTDLPEENWPWPTSDWEWRDRFAQRLKNYTLGLLWFAQNDTLLPPHFREACKQWGLAADEYPDNEGFPRQVYVREGRRLEGLDFFKATDALPQANGARPPLHPSSVTASHYALDSHAVRKREAGKPLLEGFFSYPTEVYTVPYGVMVSKSVDNLLFPVAASGSHVGFSTLRMEPCWMALGEAAGVAASISIDNTKILKEIPIKKLQEKLLQHGATLVYFRDLNTSDPDFARVQRMALLGYFPAWNAELDKPLDQETAARWSKLSARKISFNGKSTKRETMHLLNL